MPDCCYQYESCSSVNKPNAQGKEAEGSHTMIRSAIGPRRRTSKCARGGLPRYTARLGPALCKDEADAKWKSKPDAQCNAEHARHKEEASGEPQATP
jgi:hypothetical protein